VIVIDGIQVFTLKDAAPYIGIGPATLFRWMAKGKISSLLYAGRTYIKVSEADRIKKEREEKQTNGK
jgi:predicted site-specific integrase-resolvase